MYFVDTILLTHDQLQTKDGVPWPKIYGGGVEVETGEVFTAQVNSGQTCSSHCHLDSRIGGRQCCLSGLPF